MPDGTPSGAMRRRVEGARKGEGSLEGEVLYMPTGGKGRHGHPEAVVMAGVLRQAGVPADQIILETRATDTLSSIENCARLIKDLNSRLSILVATDRYHTARCLLLFRLYGVEARSLKIVSGRKANGAARWAYYYIRECCAIPWDLMVAVLRLAFGLARARASA